MIEGQINLRAIDKLLEEASLSRLFSSPYEMKGILKKKTCMKQKATKYVSIGIQRPFC